MMEVLAQLAVDRKEHEIVVGPMLLAQLDLTGMVVVIDTIVFCYVHAFALDHGDWRRANMLWRGLVQGRASRYGPAWIGVRGPILVNSIGDALPSYRPGAKNQRLANGVVEDVVIVAVV
jgi:hypothetical protein